VNAVFSRLLRQEGNRRTIRHLIDVIKQVFVAIYNEAQAEYAMIDIFFGIPANAPNTDIHLDPKPRSRHGKKYNRDAKPST